MTDRDRLLELLNSVQCKVNCCIAVDKRCADLDNLDRCQIQAIADYLIENGVILPPYKVGDTVYYFSCDFGTILPYFVENLNIAYLGEKGENYVYTFEANCNHENELLDSIDFEPDDIGKTVFLTPEEAEKALERSKSNA